MDRRLLEIWWELNILQFITSFDIASERHGHIYYANNILFSYSYILTSLVMYEFLHLGEHV